MSLLDGGAEVQRPSATRPIDLNAEVPLRQVISRIVPPTGRRNSRQRTRGGGVGPVVGGAAGAFADLFPEVVHLHLELFRNLT